MNKIEKYFKNQTALKYKNFRLFLVGQCLSNVGTWIQRLAMIWLAYKLTNSAFLLGLVGFCEQIPIFILAPFAGVYADRWNKKKALIIIESLAMLQAILLAIMTFTGYVTIWHIIPLSLFLGTINAFEVPMRQSFVIDMVSNDKKALPNAIALNSIIFNLSRLIGPSVSGILIASVGEAWCFTANGISYACVVISLLLMKFVSVPKVIKTTESVWNNLKDGFVYIKSQKLMGNLLLLLAFLSFSVASLKTLAPIFAKNILHGNANTLGYLMTASGVGAILGAIFLSNNKKTSVLFKIVSMNAFILGISIILFGLSKWLFLSLIFLAITGLAQMTHTASTNTLLQLKVSDDKRGRVMSFYTVALQGAMPFGSLVAGSIAEYTSVSFSMICMGLICITGGLIYYFNTRNIKLSGRD